MKYDKKSKNDKYFLGLDVGTESIGWAVTDEDYELLRDRGRDFWGVYLFDEASTAAGRRGFRTARRRVARTRQRIKLLQELFAEEVVKKDAGFFYRLEDSKLLARDKKVRGKYGIFNDESFTDKDYYKKYPTIYHLRAAFLDPEEAKSIADVRLLYLAVHHIVKNRGHFLFEGQKIEVDDKTNVKKAFFNINGVLAELNDENEQSVLVLESIDEALDILVDKKVGKSEKERKLKSVLHASQKPSVAVIKAIVGKKVNFKELFGDEEEREIKDFCFDDVNYSDDSLRSVLSEEEFFLIEQLKTIYDWAVLTEILGDYSYISQAMVEKYEEHHRDVILLKQYIDEHCPERKKEVFHLKSKDLANYPAYVGDFNKQRSKKASKEEFYKYLKTLNITDAEISRKIDEGTFMQKLRTPSNGVIPYQVHEAELRIILKNASANFPFLDSKEDGYTVEEKIIKLLTFRIPYYVGPLNDAHAESGFAWVKKYPGTERLKITPWNFDDIVDKNASEDEFINRMTNKCTYLVGEDVLPKASILYQEFMLLNELNNLTFCGNRLDESGRKAVYELALTEKKVTLAKIGKRLEMLGYIEKGEGKKENFGGVDGEFKSSMSSYIFMRKVFGECYDRDVCERIIVWFTVMSDKERIAERIRRELKLPNDTIKKLKDFNCSGWGKLSKKLLTEIYELNGDGEISVGVGGEVRNIITAMRETGKNFMELLSAKYGYLKAIEDYNGDLKGDNVTYKTVVDLYCSPSVKRAIWRTVCLVKEITKIQGLPPERIFVEVARGEETDKKGKTIPSRKQRIIDLYKNIKDESRDWKSEIENTPDNKFSSDKLLLYYMQRGVCAYTGKAIKLEEVFNTNIVDIDHVYPQSKIKDDSLNNRVLCYKTVNNAKQDEYPIASDVRAKMTPTWREWKEHQLISDEKYYRLTRSTPLSLDECADFINRQLVETRQSTKAIIKILKTLYPDTEVVYSKAKNVSDFKDLDGIKFKKVREVNDLHHAKDAYFNIVVGNTYLCKYNRDPLKFLRLYPSDQCTVKCPFAYEVKGAWKPSYKSRIRQIALRDTCRVVRFTSMGNGELFNATVKKKGANDKLVPLKATGAISDTSKYGGYDSATTAYFSLVLSDGKKGERLLSLEAIPIYIDKLGTDKKLEYLVKNGELKNPKIVLEPIKLNSLLNLNGAYVWLKGKTNKQIVLCNANQLLLNENDYAYVKNISKYLERNKKARKVCKINEFDGITADQNLAVYKLFCGKLSQKPYSLLPGFGAQIENLSRGEEGFMALSIEKQCDTLFEILRLFQCNRTLSNLTSLGGGAHAGTILCSKFIKPTEKVLLITQSPTGHYRNVTNLLDYYNE